jgi:hypothetical protein
MLGNFFGPFLPRRFRAGKRAQSAIDNLFMLLLALAFLTVCGFCGWAVVVGYTR